MLAGGWPVASCVGCIATVWLAWLWASCGCTQLTSLCTRFTCVAARGCAGWTRHVYSQMRSWLPQTAVQASAGRTTLMPHWALGASHGHLSLRQRARHNLTKNLQMLWFGLKLIFYNCTLESFFRNLIGSTIPFKSKTVH